MMARTPSFAVDHRRAHGLERRLDLDQLRRHVARDLVGHQHADLVEQAAEAVGAAVLLPHQRQLVLDQRVVMWCTFGRHGTPCERSPVQNTVPSLSATGGCRPVAARRRSRPAAQLPPSSRQASGRSGTWRGRARTIGASSSSSATVSARHSITRARCRRRGGALREGRRRAARARRRREQPAVAVFRQAGERIQPSTSCRPSTGSSSEYASHWLSLWNGTQPALAPCRRRGAPDVADQHAVKHLLDRQMALKASSSAAGARRLHSDAAAPAGGMAEVVQARRVRMVDEARRTGRRWPSARRSARGRHSSQREAAHQAARPSRPDHGAGCPPRTWKMSASAAASADAPASVPRQRIAGVATKSPGGNARNSPRPGLAAPRSPARRSRSSSAPGAGVEQHADRREIDARTRAIAILACPALARVRHAVHAAG